jgi:hypothetical protein
MLWVRIPLGRCALDTTICDKVFSDLRPIGVFSGFSGFLHQQNWPPGCNWNIVESGFKHLNPNPNTNSINSWYKYCAIYHALKTREGVCKVKLDMVVSVELKKNQPHSYNEEEHLRASHYLKAEKVYPHHRDVRVYLYIGMILLFRRNNVSCPICYKYFLENIYTCELLK